MNRVAITGATGAIGIALIKHCIKRGVETYVFTHKGSKRNDHIPKHPLMHIVYCELDELGDFDPQDLPEIDVFYHFAWMKAFGEKARDDLDTQIKNISYSVNAVRLANKLGCRLFIGAGSQAEYGRYGGKLAPDTPCFPENGYGMAKLAAGQMTRLECEKLHMGHIWVRVLSVYGPYDGEGTLIMSVIRDALEGRNPECTKAEQIWDYLYSDDAGEAFFLLGSKGKPGRTYVLGNGDARHLKDYIEEICDACAETESKVTADSVVKTGVPERQQSDSARRCVKPVYGARPYSAKQVMHLEADITQLTADTGYVPETDFKSGIRKTINWIIGGETQQAT